MNATTEELERFIVECQPDLDTIKASLTVFNIFNVLGVQYREIRHSNFLGWLFDPNESHQLGGIFLKDLFKLICNKGLLSSEQLLSLSSQDLSDTQVYRESLHNIDILIVNKALGFAICIENKIHANYSEHQLKKYHTYVEEHYKHVTNKFYLTLTPSESYSHFERCYGKKYTNIDYGNVVQIIKSNQNLLDNTSPQVKESVNQYVDMVEKNITKDSKEVLLAQRIYKKYKKELEFIFQNQHDFSVYQEVLNGFVKNNHLKGYIMSHDMHSNVVHILPDNKVLLELFKFPEAKAWSGEYIFSLIIFLEKEEVVIKWGFGEIEASENQKQIIDDRYGLFDEMKDLPIFKSNIATKLGFKLLSEEYIKDDKLKRYPKIGSVVLFTDEDLKKQELTFMEFFQERFKILDYELIKPWVSECIQTFGK